jgi:hypothetical protein
MGIEPTSSVWQVIEYTHPCPLIWAQNFTNFVHCLALRITDDMAVDSQRNTRVRMSHLCLRNGRICAYIH